MNTFRATVFLLALVLSGGCASVAPDGTECAGVRAKDITIKYQRHNKITVAPPRREVTRGEAIRYKVVGGEPRNFTTSGVKGPGSFSWLDVAGVGGTEKEPKYYYVCVDSNQTLGDYEYEIEVDGVGKLDPIVQVR